MQYRLFVPPGYDAAKKYPIVLWLHGANGRGSDNLLQISGGNYLGTHVWTSPEIQAKDPVFVLAPQVENTKTWSRPHVNTGAPVSLRLALEIVDAVEKEYSIDRDREYVAGQSMGGEGVWTRSRWPVAVSRRQWRCAQTASTIRSRRMQKFLCGFFKAKPTLSSPLSGRVNGWQRYAKREVRRNTPKFRASATMCGKRRSPILKPRLGFCLSGTRSERPRLSFFRNCKLYRARDFAM
jgi:Putative esterase